MAIPRSAAAIGIMFSIMGAIAFTLNDVGIKFLAGDYALHQVVFIRSLIAMSMTLLIFIPLEGGIKLLKTKRPVRQFLRGLSVVFTNMTFFMGLAILTLSEATAVFFVSPLVITIFSVLFLSEQVGVHRWGAVLVGLFGAMFIIKPGTDAFQWAVLFPFIAAIGYATIHTLTRSMAATERAATTMFYTLLTFLAVNGLLGILSAIIDYQHTLHPSIDFITRIWVMPPLDEFMIMALVGCASGLGGYFITQAYSRCESALVAPFEYFGLILAVFWGVWLFDEWPDLLSWGGICCILFAGLYVIFREITLNKKVAIERPMPRNR